MIVVLIATAAILLGTWLGAPTLAAILVGLAVGFLQPRFAARRAALAGLLAWGGVLAVGAVSGSSIAASASALGGAVGVPGWVILLATLLYPAVLASSAAWLGHLAAAGRFPTIDLGRTSRAGQPNT